MGKEKKRGGHREEDEVKSGMERDEEGAEL